MGTCGSANFICNTQALWNMKGDLDWINQMSGLGLTEAEDALTHAVTAVDLTKKEVQDVANMMVDTELQTHREDHCHVVATDVLDSIPGPSFGCHWGQIKS